MGPSGYSGKSLTGETQMPPQFVGRTVNETYLSPRGGSLKVIYHKIYQSANQ